MDARSRKPWRYRLLAPSCVALLALSAVPSIAAGDVVPDFSLPDVNETSARYGELVSPRDYLGQVSAWYFGHAT
jgi:hypothetical protein